MTAMKPLNSFLNTFAARFLLPDGKMVFVDTLPQDARLLDVGCGNNSPQIIKSRRPDIHYCGIDVADYNQSPDATAYADEYLVTSPELFSHEIAQFTDHFDAVISAHNLEHCDRPDEVLTAMLRAIKVGGKLYLSFPCAASVGFPNRAGCLNFYDDMSHKNMFCFNDILATIEDSGYLIEFCVQNYRPVLLRCLGFLLEPLGHLFKRNMPFGATWAYYGFETIIRAKRVGPKLTP